VVAWFQSWVKRGKRQAQARKAGLRFQLADFKRLRRSLAWIGCWSRFHTAGLNWRVHNDMLAVCRYRKNRE